VKQAKIAPIPKEKPVDPKNGPGTYNADKAIEVTKPRPKSALISKTERKTDIARKPQGPDPGNYNPTGFAENIVQSRS